MEPFEVFEVIGRWFWLIAILVTVVNAATMTVRSKKRPPQESDLHEGDHRLIRGLLTWGNVPWFVMGIGILAGGVPSIFFYFRPRDGNPWVLAFFAVVVLLWVLGSWWILARCGAETLVRHRRLLDGIPSSPGLVKLLWFVMVAGGVVAFVVMFAVEFPIPGGA